MAHYNPCIPHPQNILGITLHGEIIRLSVSSAFISGEVFCLSIFTFGNSGDFGNLPVFPFVFLCVLCDKSFVLPSRSPDHPITRDPPILNPCHPW
jgi:hypothetical protein